MVAFSSDDYKTWLNGLQLVIHFGSVNLTRVSGLNFSMSMKPVNRKVSLGCPLHVFSVFFTRSLFFYCAVDKFDQECIWRCTYTDSMRSNYFLAMHRQTNTLYVFILY